MKAQKKTNYVFLLSDEPDNEREGKVEEVDTVRTNVPLLSRVSKILLIHCRQVWEFEK